MGDWLTRVRFPDGRVLYATYLSGASCVSDEVYSDYIPQAPLDANGHAPFGRERSRVDEGSKLPQHLDLPVSDPDDLNLVTLDVEGNGSVTALFCPRRNQIIGPRFYGMGDLVQRQFRLIDQNDRQHLAFPEAAQVLCGQPRTGKELPYHYFEWGEFRTPDPLPPLRDLFREWNGGQVCRACLLQAVLTCKNWSWDDGAKPAPSPPDPPIGLGRRLLRAMGFGGSG